MTTTLIVTGILLLIFIGYGVYNYRRIKNMPDVSPNEHIKNLTDLNFQQQISKGISLVDFWASWCMPCKVMSPVLNETAEELHGQINIFKINVEQYTKMASKYRIKGIPSLILFKDGHEIDRFIGVKSKEFLIKKINSQII